MKKYTILSIILHGIAFVILTLITLTPIDEEKSSSNDHIDVELGEGGDGNNKGSEDGSNTKIIEMDISGNKHTVDNIPFYYGIGVNAISTSEGFYITDVFDGYVGRINDIRVKDIVTHINNSPVSYSNDLKSTDKPRILILTIKRNDVTLYISLTTEKIYYQ